MANKVIGEELGNGVKDSSGFSWIFSGGPETGKQEAAVSPEDKAVLRGLAQKVKQLSELPIQEERRRLWADHHSLKETRPLIFIDPERAWFELIPHTGLQCRGNLARIWEFRLRKEIIWQECIKDDRACCASLPVQHVYSESGFGIDWETRGGENGGSYRIMPGLTDYDDLGKMHFRKIEIDYEKTNQLLSVAHDVFDGLLNVHIENSWWYSFGLTDKVIHLRGFNNFLTDFYEYPDELHALMKFLSDDAMNRLDFLENNKLLSLNNGCEDMGTGGFGWCDELPGEPFDPGWVRPRNMWGYGESQETVSVSPEMFAEFVLPYQIPLLSRFGLNAYGCCEDLKLRIPVITEKIPRLRKITVSPWSDTKKMAELIGKNFVYCWKMNPAYIASETVYEEKIRESAGEAFSAARKHGCPVEVLARDIQTLASRMENAVLWVRIMREESKKIYG
jgi:hypothetical protein